MSHIHAAYSLSVVPNSAFLRVQRLIALVKVRPRPICKEKFRGGNTARQRCEPTTIIEKAI